MVSIADKERRKKALLYTAIICGGLLLLFILISWRSTPPPPPPPPPDEIEVNLGNNDEGLGEEQPLVKGDRSPENETVPTPTPVAASNDAEEKVTPEDNAEPDAAPVVKPEKKTPKIKTPVVTAPVVTPTPKPRQPKIVYNGPGKQSGNNPTTDNGYTMQGKDPNGKADHGEPTGDKDSYGNTPGGKTGGPKVISGNRKVIRYYSFTGNLDKATINAIIKVSPAGTGTFVGFGKGSTATGANYASAIAGYLRNMQFDKAADESTVTVQFNFNVN